MIIIYTLYTMNKQWKHARATLLSHIVKFKQTKQPESKQYCVEHNSSGAVYNLNLLNRALSIFPKTVKKYSMNSHVRL